MTKVCAVSTDSETPSKAKKLGADAVEYRFDMFKKIPTDFSFDEDIINIATLRGVTDKLDFFNSTLESGADFVDIESDSPLRNSFCKNNTICSYHDFEKTPSEEIILKIIDDLKTSGLPKAAFAVNTASDLIEIYKASQTLKKSGDPFILIGMNDAGELTRVRADLLGSEFTYCSVSKKSAAGQLTVSEAIYLKNPIVTGIIGYPLTHTFSPKIHNAAFEAARISGRYVIIPCRPDELPLIKEIMTAYKISGLNVTIPHKEKIIPFLSKISRTAIPVGAVNTITEDFTGDNTDVKGIAASLDSANPIEKKVLLIGSGGAARAAAFYFAENKADLTITNRTFEKAQALAREFHAKAVRTDNLKPEFDIILNATPASINADIFSKGCIVMDMKYPSSEFLEMAKSAGANTISGKIMLVNQAAESFKIWTGVSPDINVMMDAFEVEK